MYFSTIILGFRVPAIREKSLPSLAVLRHFLGRCVSAFMALWAVYIGCLGPSCFGNCQLFFELALSNFYHSPLSCDACSPSCGKRNLDEIVHIDVHFFMFLFNAVQHVLISNADIASHSKNFVTTSTRKKSINFTLYIIVYVMLPYVILYVTNGEYLCQYARLRTVCTPNEVLQHVVAARGSPDDDARECLAERSLVLR